MPRLASVFSVRSVLLIQVALPILVMMAVILVVSLSVISHFTEERLQRNIRLLARAISLPVTEALERRDVEQIENSLASVFDISEVYGAYLFDDEGRQLVSLGSVNPSRSQAVEALRQTHDGEFAQYENIDGRDVYSYFLPLVGASEQPTGLLQVTRRRSDIQNQLTELKIWAWTAFGLLSLLFLGTVSLAHQRSIGRPLNRLLDSMQQVEAGNRTHRARHQGPKEVRELADGLNGMLNAIEQAEQRVVQQREKQEKMAEKLRQAETLAALGQLSAGVAHELGAPLSVVSGRAHRLQRRLSAPEDIRELTEIREQTARMTSIIEQLLSYGRRSRSKPRRLNVPALAQRAKLLVEDEIADSRIVMKGTGECHIHGDSLSLEQALVNLLRNAIQASPRHHAWIDWHAPRDPGGPAELMVEDDGPGISPQDEAKVFDPFFTGKAPGEGSGLGLAIVKRVMRDHNASISVGASEYGGACFRLAFPEVDATRSAEVGSDD